MTRTFNTKVRCENCHADTTQETDLERWIRGNPRLPSSVVVRFDCDIFVHRYKCGGLYGGREYQAMMFIEAKTNGSDATYSQRDTFGSLEDACGGYRVHEIQKEYGPVKLLTLGSYVLSFPGNDLSGPIMWRHLSQPFTALEGLEHLERILRFENDPLAVNFEMDVAGIIALHTRNPQLFHPVTHGNYKNQWRD